jgi:hypothetical protein
MQDSNPFPKGIIWVICITAVAMMVLSFEIMRYLGANIEWCILSPIITIGFFFLFIYVMKHSGKKKKIKFFKIELPTLFIGLPTWLIVGYIWSGIKLIISGTGLHTVGIDSSFWSIFFLLLTTSTILNFFGNLVVWHLGGKQWVHSIRTKIITEVKI